MIPSDQENYRQFYKHDEQFFAHINEIRSQYTLPHGPLIYGLVHAINPAFIIETGTCNGYLTAWIAKAVVELNYRKFYTIDWYNENYPHAAPGTQFIIKENLQKCGVLDGVSKFIESEALSYFRYAADRQLLEGLNLVILDDKYEYSHLMEELNICWDNLIPGGVIAIHNTEHPHNSRELGRCVDDFVTSRGISRKLHLFTSFGMDILQKDW